MTLYLIIGEVLLLAGMMSEPPRKHLSDLNGWSLYVAAVVCVCIWPCFVGFLITRIFARTK